MSKTDPELLREWAWDYDKVPHGELTNKVKERADRVALLRRAADAIEERDKLLTDLDTCCDSGVGFQELREALRELVEAEEKFLWGHNPTAQRVKDLQRVIAKAKEELGE
jgi:hypothetical protein